MSRSFEPFKGFERQKRIDDEEGGDKIDRQKTAHCGEVIQAERVQQTESRKGVNAAADAEKNEIEGTDDTGQSHTFSMRSNDDIIQNQLVEIDRLRKIPR